MMTGLLVPRLATPTLATKKMLPGKVLPFFLTCPLYNAFNAKSAFIQSICSNTGISKQSAASFVPKGT
jgi:hypothetical protein